MTLASELQAQLDAAHAELRRRDTVEAEAKAAALAAQNATADATDAAARVEAATKERERIRSGAWCSYLLGQANPTAPFDFAALQIPADGWPPNAPESNFVFSGGVVSPSIDISKTHLGKLLATKGRI
jgi:hypothetical protein